MNKTEWFPVHVKPVREGVYEVLAIFSDNIFFSYWNGINWGLMSRSSDTAFRNKDDRSNHQDRSWRGLTEQSK